jgi:aminoglycoside phosphotransferase family enzyme
VEVRETHISWVFLAGELVFKLKKPLVLEFLDYGTPERRRQICEEEVRLNGRLASDICLGVRGVAMTEQGVKLTAEEARARSSSWSRRAATTSAKRSPPESSGVTSSVGK